MNDIAMEVAFRAMMAMAPSISAGEPYGTHEFMRHRVKEAARAVMQLWGDLEREGQRASKAIA